MQVGLEVPGNDSVVNPVKNALNIDGKWRIPRDYCRVTVFVKREESRCSSSAKRWGESLASYRLLACSAGKNRLVLETSWHRENQPAQFHPASTHAANRKPSSFQTDGANSTGCVQPRKKWRQQIFHSVAPNPSSIQIKIQHLK